MSCLRSTRVTRRLSSRSNAGSSVDGYKTCRVVRMGRYIGGMSLNGFVLACWFAGLWDDPRFDVEGTLSVVLMGMDERLEMRVVKRRLGVGSVSSFCMVSFNPLF